MKTANKSRKKTNTSTGTSASSGTGGSVKKQTKKRTSRSSSSNTDSGRTGNQDTTPDIVKTTEKKTGVSTHNVVDKIQKVMEEHEATIHLVLDIAAITIRKSNMSEKNKRISRAALALVSEIVGGEEEIGQISGNS
jgi:hypothetical protein